MKYNLST